MPFPMLDGRKGVLSAGAPSAFGYGVRSPYERSASIDDVFAARALAAPHSIAVVAAGRTIAYGELAAAADRIAGELRRRGARPGSHVGIALERCADLPAALLGILRAGAAYVPLDPSYPRERLATMVADASIELVVGEEDGRSFAGTAAACVGVASAPSAPGEHRTRFANDPDSLAYVTYTSGSTGKPKGVAIEHRGVVRLVRNTDYVRIGPGDTLLHCAPLAFDASTFEIWGALLNGARVAIPPGGLLSIGELAACIERFEATVVFLTSALFARLVDVPGLRLSSLRCLITGGEVLSVTHARRFLEAFPHCRLLNAYGPTENTTFSTMHPIGPHDLNGSVPIGHPIANSTAFVLDEQLRPVAVGESGELCVGGDGVARGYLNAPELSAERFVKDPFSGDPAARLYRTGDRARLREDGAIEFLGRTDAQYKVRGHRVEAGEIETALLAHPGVREAAVVPVTRDGEIDLIAHVAAEAGSRFSERDLRAHLARTLPAYMLPHRIVIRAGLPLNSSGKIDRTRLASEPLPPSVATPKAAARFSRDPGAVARERAVADIWRDALGGDCDPALDENFFDAGGDSLRLLAVQARLSDRFGVALKATDLFEHTTIRSLAAFLERQGARV